MPPLAIAPGRNSPGDSVGDRLCVRIAQAGLFTAYIDNGDVIGILFRPVVKMLDNPHDLESLNYFQLAQAKVLELT